ncbi:MAG: TRAP transporter substrate-binding protein DctP [Deltaproteobacteria bacterium]|nr:TRAP transporter substrate-binding protein DctP [Deltaproteobacteria bacterium]
MNNYILGLSYFQHSIKGERTMIQKLRTSTLLIALAIAVASVTGNASAQDKGKKYLRIAMLAPRGSVVERMFKKIDKHLRDATNNEWGLRIYASGAAGDEKDVIRKMRVGQMDSAIVTTTGLSQIVREVAILDTPGIVTSYEDIKKIEDAMWDEWQKMFLKNNVKLIKWYPAGRYRVFTNGPVTSANDLKSHRPWLWPESFVLKELWRTIGATGVPLAVQDVYGALQTGMIDTFVSTCMSTVAMQWHTKVNHMTAKPTGVLLLAWVINQKAWDSLPQAAKDVIEKDAIAFAEDSQRDAEKEEDASCKNLLKRGFKLSRAKDQDEVEKKVRDRVTGRIFSAELRQRLEKVTGHSAD